MFRFRSGTDIPTSCDIELLWRSGPLRSLYEVINNMESI